MRGDSEYDAETLRWIATGYRAPRDVGTANAYRGLRLHETARDRKLRKRASAFVREAIGEQKSSKARAKCLRRARRWVVDHPFEAFAHEGLLNDLRSIYENPANWIGNEERPT